MKNNRYLILIASSLFVTACGDIDLSGDHNISIENPNENQGFDSPGIPIENSKKVTFTETSKALKNPLKGFMIWPNDTKSSQKYVSMFKAVIPWNKLENSLQDSAEKAKEYSSNSLFDNRWFQNKKYSVQDKNIKVNPLVLLKKSGSDDFSPSDMDISEHNNQTKAFADRLRVFIPKLAEAWDNDPRIGFINMGIVGTWGEQWSTAMSPEVAKALGDSFTKHFKNKKVLVRVPNYFEKTYLQSHNNVFRGNRYTNYYRFGMYWDAFGWSAEMTSGGLDTDDVLKNAKMWTDQPILGEVAFNVNYKHIYDYFDYPNLSWPQNSKKAIHDTLTHEKTLDYMKDYIRSAHCTGLSWISLYNENDAAEAKGAEELQKIMGYRFVLKDASYSASVEPGGKIEVAFDVKNNGSAPFYYDWPVEVSLLDKSSKKVVWSDTFKNVDIRSWSPGDNWDFKENRYKKSAKNYSIKEDFTLPSNLKEGEYILALSIVDPAGMKPSVRFAVTHYYSDGRAPLGMVGIGVEPTSALPQFDDVSNTKLGYAKE